MHKYFAPKVSVWQWPLNQPIEESNHSCSHLSGHLLRWLVLGCGKERCLSTLVLWYTLMCHWWRYTWALRELAGATSPRSNISAELLSSSFEPMDFHSLAGRSRYTCILPLLHQYSVNGPRYDTTRNTKICHPYSRKGRKRERGHSLVVDTTAKTCCACNCSSQTCPSFHPIL